MVLFKTNLGKAVKLQNISLSKEKQIQNLFENNLEILLDILFVKTEHTTSFGGRIDTLGIDKNGSPVIIEYKLSKDDNVINQGLSYLKWLLDHKAEFEQLCKSKSISIDIDWASPRVICVAESYNKFDLDTVEILPIKIELYRYSLYEDNILQIELESQMKVKINTSEIFNKAKKEKTDTQKLQREYLVEDHLKIATDNTKELFLKIRELITSIDNNIVEEAKAKYIAYKITNNFVDIVIQKNALKIFVNMPSGKLEDKYNIARDLTKPKKIGHWGNGDYEIIIENSKDVVKVFGLIEQSYLYNK